MNWTRRLIIAYVVLGALTLIAFSPSLLFAAILFTFGLAIPIAFLPSIFLYATAAMTAVVLRWHDWSSRSAAIFATAAVLSVALVLPAFQEIVARIASAEVASSDFTSPLPQHPRRLTIVRSASHHAGADTPLRDAICDAICQKLLLNREVDLVNISIRYPNGAEKASVSYSVEKRAACPPAFSRAEDALPETVTAIALGTCIIPAIGRHPKVDLIVSDTVLRPHGRETDAVVPPYALVIDLRRIRRFEVIVPGRSQRLLMRQTETTAKLVSAPLLILPSGGFPPPRDGAGSKGSCIQPNPPRSRNADSSRLSTR